MSCPRTKMHINLLITFKYHFQNTQNQIQNNIPKSETKHAAGIAEIMKARK